METQKKGTRKVTKSRGTEIPKKKADDTPGANFKLQIRKDFSDEFPLTKDDEKEIIKILFGPKFTQEGFRALPKKERDRLLVIFSKAVNRLALEDREKFLDRVDAIIQNDNRRDLWEQNHFQILKAIDSLTRKFNRFPSRMEIQNDTQLSRKTIHKHLREYFGSEAYAEKKEEYFAMRENALARLYIFASEGNIKAARLFMEATAFTAEQPKIQNQNNYLQFNSLTITQDQINQLPAPEQEAFLQILKRFHEPVTKVD